MAKSARSLIMVTCSNRQGGNSVPYIMTRHQWLGSKRWLLFRSKVPSVKVFSKSVLGPLYVCKRLQTNCQCVNSSVGTHFLSWHQSGENYPRREQSPPYSAERHPDGRRGRHFINFITRARARASAWTCAGVRRPRGVQGSSELAATSSSSSNFERTRVLDIEVRC
jgi:hypothetical protein